MLIYASYGYLDIKCPFIFYYTEKSNKKMLINSAINSLWKLGKIAIIKEYVS